jgi:hypothetical protein
MPRKTILTWLLFSVALLTPLRGSAQEPPNPITPLTAEELQRLIDTAGGDWVAGETSVARLPPERQRRLLGLAPGALDPVLLSRLPTRATSTPTTSLPPSVDWRDQEGNWTTPIRDQENCGSCVAFGTLGAVESRLKIYHGDPNENPDLSEQHLFFCGGGDCETGWFPPTAMDIMRDTGAVDEPCDPYDPDDQSCSPCSDWQSRVTRTHCWYYASGRDNVRQAIAHHGPVEAVMKVYQDFYYYSGGIYLHTWGDREGGHAVTLVGYDDDDSYWVAKNSWGTGWGEEGWFRAAYGDVIYDSAYVPVFDAIPPGTASNPRPDGWNGPYTNDRTPSFRWDPAADDADGCGVQGYYAAVDDWTPEGSEDTDWWAGYATDFSVPSPLAEGEHIFAVTAVDVGGNPNPTDTNQPGDAPYYAFTVDTTPPQSHVASLVPETPTSFTVSWSGSDTASPIASYDLQMQEGGNLWQDWLTNITDTSATRSGMPGRTYCFRSRAHDQADNAESWPSSPDACITVVGLAMFLPTVSHE